MRLFYIVICCSILFNLITKDSYAQNAYHSLGLGLGYAYRDFSGIPQGDLNKSNFDGALHLHVGAYINRSFDMAISSTFTTLNLSEKINIRDLIELDGALRYKFNNGYIFKETSFLAPYITAGINLNQLPGESDKVNSAIPLGAGMQFQMGKSLTLDIMGIYKSTLSGYRDVFSALAILRINFAKGRSIYARDSDRDGVVDLSDECPLEAGLIRFGGCPDADLDSVVDKFDKCPNEPGLPSLQGCPERLSDTDKDGVVDGEDKCPSVYGLAALKGCPDTDGDGIPDLDDACPYEPGPRTQRGCPDRDVDGVPDLLDQCPDEPGSAAFQGCPDTDGDGIIDKEDKCPTLAGTPSLKGCPIVDGDSKETLETAVKNIQFESSKAVLLPSSYKTLDAIAAILKKYTGYGLQISGHTDAVGDENRNQLLSEQRAKACVDYLLKQGIAPNRLKYVGYGELRPIADNINETGRIKNRRVDFELFLP